jgi:hypothetical protein
VGVIAGAVKIPDVVGIVGAGKPQPGRLEKA